LEQRSTYHLARWAFLRLVGLCYLIAFVSLWTQALGLIRRANGRRAPRHP